jgi:electron transfer flavoprotein beta subunit
VAVFVKNTPDSAAKVEVDAGGAVTWGNTPLILNPWDEYAVTEAVLLKEAHKVKTTALAVGPEVHNDALKQCLAIGIDQVFRVWDEGMAGQDTLGYAKAAAAAVQKLGDVSLIIFGREQIDLSTDTYVYQIARKLGWAVFGSVSKIATVDFGAKTIKVERLIEEGKQTISAKLPAVISVLKDINEPKSPSFIGIRKAAKAVIPVWSGADLGIGETAGGSAALTHTVAYHNLPARQGAVQMIDGATEQERAEKLVTKLLEEKVL